MHLALARLAPLNGTPAGAHAATEGIAGAIRLVAAHRARIEGVVTYAGVGRGGEATVRFPTLREMAERTPVASALAARLIALADRAGAFAADKRLRMTTLTVMASRGLLRQG